MAVNMMMIKKCEDDEKVVYYFGPLDDSLDPTSEKFGIDGEYTKKFQHKLGEIQMDKIQEIISELSPAGATYNSSDFFYKRAAVRLARFWKNGEYPDKSYIQS